jgi:hypothetical protein
MTAAPRWRLRLDIDPKPRPTLSPASRWLRRAWRAAYERHAAHKATS